MSAASLSDLEFSAEKMRQVATESHMYQLMDEWRDTRLKIEKSAKSGCFSVTFSGFLHKETIQRLEDAGFKISDSSCRNESYVRISWEKEPLDGNGVEIDWEKKSCLF